MAAAPLGAIAYRMFANPASARLRPAPGHDFRTLLRFPRGTSSIRNLQQPKAHHEEHPELGSR